MQCAGHWQVCNVGALARLIGIDASEALSMPGIRTVWTAADIDIARARAAKQRAEESMRGEHDATVESALRRAHARLAASGGVNETLGAKH